jgi:peptide/nickel transport system substrate-binding protein
VSGSNKRRRWLGVVIALGLIAVLVGACGSSGGGTSSSSASGPATPSIVSGLKQTGPGLTEPSKGSGTRIKGGTVTFAEAPDSPPNYIFPMYSAEFCGLSNNFQLNVMLYRPLYWYGNNYDPTVDYNDSIGDKPTYSNSGKTVTIHLKNYKWSDGEQVSARDLVFWMNIMKADPAKEWCGYVPGKTFFPGNVLSYKAVNTSTFQLTLNKAYNPTWVQYNLLSQLTPMPIAWDRTSLSAKAPSPTAANLPDTTKAGANAVYNFLNKQGQGINSWASSPLWSIVDGPWRVQSTTSNGGVTLVPNKDFSGPNKPSLAKFEEVPYTSESAMMDAIKSQGPSSVSFAYIPAQYQPLTSSLRNAGYDVNMASSYSIGFFVLNINNPTIGRVFSQLYFRQALQHLVDQDGWISHFLHGTAVSTYGPVPAAPPSSILPGIASKTNPFAFSVSAASQLLKSHGWKVVPGGQTTCAKPGTAANECGAGVKQGQPITFNIDYASDTVSLQEEMQDLQSQAAKVGVKITLSTHPYNDTYSVAVLCKPSQPDCKWTAENWGTGWIYGPGYFPTGEDLFLTGSVSNHSNYSDAKMNTLIDNTITSPAAKEQSAMKAYVKYAETSLPVVWTPTPIGTFTSSAGTLISKKLGGYAANAFGWLSPEDWYMTK